MNSYNPFQNDPRVQQQYMGLARQLANPAPSSAPKSLSWLPELPSNFKAGISTNKPDQGAFSGTGISPTGDFGASAGGGHATPGPATNGMSIGQAIGNALGFTNPFGAVVSIAAALANPNAQTLGLKGLFDGLFDSPTLDKAVTPQDPNAYESATLGANAAFGTEGSGFGPAPGAGGDNGATGPSGSSPGSTSGGSIGAEAGTSGTGNDNGGSAPGGEMKHGGLVRGVGDGDDDTNMRWLSNGEFVMPADKTAKLFPALEYMRRTGKLPGPDALK